MSTPALAAALLCGLAAGALVPPRPLVGRPVPEGRTVTVLGAGPPDPAGVRTRLAATTAAGIGALVTLGPVVGAAVAPVAVLLTWRLTGRLEAPSRRRRREELAGAVPLVVDLLAAALAAGLSPSAAVGHVAAAIDGPMRQELSALSARLHLAEDPLATWRDLAGHQQLGPVGRCLHRAVRSGVSVAAAMSRLAEDLRRDARARVEEQARGVGVRAAVPLGLCLLPAFVLVGVVPLVAGSLPVVLGR